WHDYEGTKLLLEHQVDPNRITHWRHSALHQAVKRDNDLAQIDLLLDYGADPTLPNAAEGQNAIQMATRRGRGDVLNSFKKRGFSLESKGLEKLIIACALDDASSIPEA